MDLKSLLAAVAKNNDEKAFRIFFDQYYARLIKFALLFIPQQEQAEDIVSEVLIKLLKKRKWLHKIANLEGYLFLAVKNQAISVVRKQKLIFAHQHRSLDLEKDSLLNYQDPLNQLTQSELRDVIDQAINQLPPRRQMIYKLVKEEQLKIKEVAKIMDIAPKTVENHLDMAMKQMRSAVSEYLNDESIVTPVIKMIKTVTLIGSTILGYWVIF